MYLAETKKALKQGPETGSKVLSELHRTGEEPDRTAVKLR